MTSLRVVVTGIETIGCKQSYLLLGKILSIVLVSNARIIETISIT